MFDALGPVKKYFDKSFFKGKTPLFFNSTIAFCATSLAIALCLSLFTTSPEISSNGLLPAGSNKPNLNLVFSKVANSLSISASVISPCFTASGNPSK